MKQIIVICILIIGISNQLSSQISKPIWGDKFKFKGGFLVHKYFVGATDDHFYYVFDPARGGVLKKFNYQQKEILSKKLDLRFEGKKLSLHSFIESSNGKTYAILKERAWFPDMEFFISEFKDDTFGKIFQPYDHSIFKRFSNYFRYGQNLPDPYIVKQTNHQTQTYYKQSPNKKFTLVVGCLGFGGSNKTKLENEIGIVVLDENMELVWQKKLTKLEGDYLKLSQIEVSNTGAFFGVIQEKILKRNGYLNSVHSHLIYANQEESDIIKIPFTDGTIAVDLGIYADGSEGKVALGGIYDTPEPEEKRRKRTIEGLFHAVFDIASKEFTITQSKASLRADHKIKFLITPSSSQAYYMMVESLTYFYAYRTSSVHNTPSSSPTFDKIECKNGILFKQDASGAKVAEVKIGNSAEVSSYREISFIHSYYQDKLYLVFNNKRKTSFIKENSKSKTRKKSNIAVEIICLDKDFNIVHKNTVMNTVYEIGHYLVPHLSFVHDNKIVLFNLSAGRSIKIGTITLD